MDVLHGLKDCEALYKTRQLWLGKKLGFGMSGLGVWGLGVHGLGMGGLGITKRPNPKP